MLPLILRNIFLNLLSRLPQVTMVAGTMAALLVGNSLLESSRQGLKVTYSQAFTGDWSVSGVSADSFTLFGTDLPLIGEYIVTPPLPPPVRWQPVVEAFTNQASFLPQVSASAAILFPEGRTSSVAVFGVEFDRYFQFFPALQLVSGTLTPDHPRALLLNQARFSDLARQLGRTPQLGESVDLGITVNGSFVIRQVKLAGVYRYPGADPFLDRAVLVDPVTARALNGYTVGSLSIEAIDPDAVDLLSNDLDALFGEVQDSVADLTGGIDLSTTETTLKETTDRDTQNATLDGTWNFLLVRAVNEHDTGMGLRLQSSFDQAGLKVQVRDWVGTAGGNAFVVFLLQLIFSLGLGLVALVASLIVMNSLALSVAERTQEIGTMRALGATRGLVALVIGWETSLVVFGSAVIGLVFGTLVLWGIGQAGIAVSNPVLSSWLGTSELYPMLSPGLFAAHLALALALALASCVLPVTRALAISPLKAMQDEN